MRRRQPIPRLWLVTDPRADAWLVRAAEKLPRGSGILFRHYDAPDRCSRFEALRKVARRRGLVLVLAGSARDAAAWRADGAHGRSPHRRTPRPMLLTAPAHDRRELARCGAADLVFVSPVFATVSHPGSPALGPLRFATLARAARRPVMALGGMSPARYRGIVRLGADGWAAIDWFGRAADQNLKVVPR